MRPGTYNHAGVIYDVFATGNVLEVQRDGVVYWQRHKASPTWEQVWAELHADQWTEGEGS